MKAILDTNSTILLLAGILCFGLMILIDYLLGSQAEYLNAWDLVCRWFGKSSGLPESIILKRFGLIWTSVLTLAFNLLIGSVLVLVGKSIMNLFK